MYRGKIAPISSVLFVCESLTDTDDNDDDRYAKYTMARAHQTSIMNYICDAPLHTLRT